ncbi:MAG: crossover junction endodeoxyribonuclease RuvC [Rikenellaceae bacterium]|jgi:crossover junction endodeoxyribonuclease RuvC|nr:crossover junction endodeoxyribonuclease RuvC [Rikenellaceae bacterium]
MTKIIMGIDPGTSCTGYGFLRAHGGSLQCIALGYIELNKLKDPYERLRTIFGRVTGLIEKFRPDEVALESPFFGNNVQSMLKLGRAQGVAMAAALVQGLPVYEYAPRLVKQSITGAGGASKEQVAALLKKMLGVEYNMRKLDATDGLAVALCHHFQSSSPLNAASVGAKIGRTSRRGSKSWESFVNEHSDRVIKPRKI